MRRVRALPTKLLRAARASSRDERIAMKIGMRSQEAESSVLFKFQRHSSRITSAGGRGSDTAVSWLAPLAASHPPTRLPDGNREMVGCEPDQTMTQIFGFHLS